MTLPRSLSIACVALLISTPAQSWNLGAKHINALQYTKAGIIEFTLFDEGTSIPEFQCNPEAPRGQWFYISPCADGYQQCLAAVNRMASTLLAAKIAGKPIHVQRDRCEVTEVALKP